MHLNGKRMSSFEINAFKLMKDVDLFFFYVNASKTMASARKISLFRFFFVTFLTLYNFEYYLLLDEEMFRLFLSVCALRSFFQPSHDNYLLLQG